MLRISELDEKCSIWGRNNLVDFAQALAYNDIKAESLLQNLKGAMYSTKGGMPP